MLTIFTTCKPFKGHFAISQENAIASWSKLRPQCQIIILGNDEGVAKIVKKYKTLHIPKVELSRWGTPILPDLFEKAYKKATFPIIAYVNSDIILTNDFLRAVKKINFPSFFITGSRIDLDIRDRLNFNSAWQSRLKNKALTEGKFIAKHGATDYFVFTPKIDFQMPKLIIGRTFWDAWLIYKAKALKIPVIDATEVITAVHQTHDYSHAGGWKKVWTGPESKINKALTDNMKKCFNLYDVDYILTKRGLKRPKLSLAYITRKIETTPILYPNLTYIFLPLNFLLKVTWFIRDRLRKL